MKQFQDFQISKEAINSVNGGMSRSERRALRKEYRAILKQDASNYNYFANIDEDGNLTEWREPKWKGYTGGIIQYYLDNYTIDLGDDMVFPD